MIFWVNQVAPLIDHGSSVEVRIQGSQAGASYRLLAAGTEISTAPVMGNGAEISLFTTPITEDVLIRIEVSRHFDPSEGPQDLVDLLDATLQLAVRADTDPGVSVDGSPLCDHQGSAAITIARSQASVSYSAWIRRLSDSDFVPNAPPEATLVVPVPGAPDVRVSRPPRPAVWQAVPAGYEVRASGVSSTGGALQLHLGALDEDCVVVVVAHKDHSAVLPLVSDVQLQQSVAFLVRPDPAPALSVSTGGQRETLLVQGGQPGVYYHLYQDAEATGALGRPAYFHKLDDSTPSPAENKGIGLLRIHTDLAIARAPEPPGEAAPSRPYRRPLPPLVSVLPLPADLTTVSVMAVKARSGLGWSGRRPVAIELLSSLP